MSALKTKSNGISAFVGNTANAYVNNDPSQGLQCPAGLATWVSQSGVVQRSLNMSTRPGTIFNILPVSDVNNYIWDIRLENPCNVSIDTTKKYVQSGSTLIPATSGQLIPMTIGLYTSLDNKWWLRNSNTGGNPEISYTFEPPIQAPNRIPVTGDWNDDGITTAGWYDPDSACIESKLQHTNPDHYILWLYQSYTILISQLL